MPANFYHGPRWTGLWNDPNIYGMLMGSGLVLATVLLVAKERKKHKDSENRKAEGGNQESVADSSLRPFPRPAKREGYFLRSFAAIDSIVLFIAAGMMATGLLSSYSRGAWAGATVGLLYLAQAYGKFRWRWVLPLVLAAAAVAGLFWNRTTESAPWYLKRLDFSRGSVQHRLVAWRASLEIMRDHPFGVGWGKTVATYQAHYSPPEDGAEAITTNDYLMLGTQLGVPGLACFLAYVGLCFRKFAIRNSEFGIPTACRAGALTMLVAFWFDGGLFKLATASVFWILLELGAATSRRKTNPAKANQ
jgi:O-antigen ligase